MAISREALEGELRRRGALPGATASPAPQAGPSPGVGPSRQSIEAELRRRGALPTAQATPPAAAQQQQQQPEEPGFLSRVGETLQGLNPLGIVDDVRDIAEQGVTRTEQFPYFRLPESIGERAEERSQAVRDVAPFAVGGPVATLVGQGARGVATRVGAAAAGQGIADAGQQALETGTVDPAQTALAAGLGGAGQGVGELVGAAIPAAVRGLTRGGAAGRQGVQSAIDDAARVGEVPTVAQATQSSFLDSIESILAKTPGSAGRIRDQVRRTTDNVRSGLERIAQQGSPRVFDSESAGQAVIGGVREFGQRFSARSQPLFDRITSSVGANTPVPASNSLQLLQRLTTPIQGAERTSERFASPFIRGLAEDLAEDAGSAGQIPFQALQRVRTLVGDLMTNPGIGPSDVPQAQLRRIYGAISDDIRGAARAAGPDASRAFERANRFYRTGQQRIENTLDPLVKNRTPERVFDALITGSRSGPTQIRTLFRSLNGEQQDVVTGAVIRRLGTANPGQQGAEGADFSFNTFLTRWNQIDGKARNAIFRRGRNQQLGEDINALARYSERVRESSRAFFNPSGTSGATVSTVAALVGSGSVVASPVLGAGALTFPLILGSGAAAANVAGRLMTSPRVVRWLAQATRTRANGVGAHLGRLSAIAAKEDPEVQGAIADYLDLLQSPPEQGQPAAPGGQANGTDAQSLPAGGLGLPDVQGVAAVAPGGQDPAGGQAGPDPQILEQLQRIQSGLEGIQGAPAPAQQGLSPQETELRRQDMQLRQIEAENQLEFQRQAAQRQEEIMKLQIEMLKKMTEAGERPGRKNKGVRVMRNEAGDLIGAEIVEGDEN